MTDLFDHRQVRRSFSRAAHGYDNAAALQREVGARLSETLDYLDDRAPEVVVDVGCGPGHLSAAMQK
ncbi:malonyl-[acyl-carrier protein] O-methyltransferase BioC, partial [Lysobacter sp. 2RAB21]